MKKHGFRYCRECNTKLRSNGFQKNGKRRWRCLSCGTARIRKRPDTAYRNGLTGFTNYLLSSTARKDIPAASISTLVRRQQDYWSITPSQVITGEVYDYVVIDATRVGSRCVAILRNKQHVISWRFSERENSDLWVAVLKTVPKPKAIVCDGQKGIVKALGLIWPGIIIQRCLVHVKRNIRVKITNHPASLAGQDLKLLVGSLFNVHDQFSMAIFIAKFSYLCKIHEDFLAERTVNPYPAVGKRKWWYTHRNVRSAYRQIDNLIASDQLFAFVTHPEFSLPRDSNSLEGGINSPLQELLHRHRGMTQTHQERLTDWYLDSRTEFPFLTRKRH